jgi:hypothetical protein
MIEVGPVIQHLVGWMIRVLSGRFRQAAEPFHLFWWMPGDKWLNGSKASAVTEPISARRRVSDPPVLLYRRAEFCWKSGSTCTNGWSSAG